MLFLSFNSAFAIAATSDSKGHWAESQISRWIDEGFLIGYPDGSSKPDQAITRAEFITFINRSFGFSEEAPISFSDISSSDWAYTEVAKAVKAGYLIGYGDETIGASNSISRQEVAVIVDRLLNLPETASTGTSFQGDSLIAVWAKDAVDRVVSSEIMVGYGADNSFKPTKSATRAEAIVTLDRAISFKDIGTTVPTITTSPVDLGQASSYVILTKTGVSNVPTSAITGDIGVSPIAAVAITGFDLVADASNQFSTSPQVTGKIYAADYAVPSPNNLTTAISNMETAYTDAAGRAADYTELYSGDISGKTLTAGVYKWGTGVLINSDITLNGDANDVWIFQISEGITQANGTRINLEGGAQAKNIFWQAADTVSIGTNAHFEGIILGQKNITFATGASVNGRLLAQTGVTLDQNTVTKP